MTTIVYDHKARQIAVDGRVTTGNVISTESARKWVAVDGEFWFFCGRVSDQERFINQFKNAQAETPKFEIDAAALMARDGKVRYCTITEDGSPCAAEIDYSDSMGMGGDFALAALDHGIPAKKAIAYAATRDNTTGGVISVFDVEAMRFIE